jgi:hypothetical protein
LTVDTPGRGLARSASRFYKPRMAGNDVGVSRAPRAIERFGNFDNTLSNEETTNSASKALTPLESLDIIGRLHHLRLDPSKGGSMRLGSSQPILAKALEVSGPVQGPSFGFPFVRIGRQTGFSVEWDYSRFSPRMPRNLVDRGVPPCSQGTLRGASLTLRHAPWCQPQLTSTCHARDRYQDRSPPEVTEVSPLGSEYYLNGKRTSKQPVPYTV